MDQIKELEKTFLEEYKAANLLIENEMFKSSIIMLSKSLFALADYLIFIKYKKLPKNHSERFRILQIKENNIYHKLDQVWSKYTDSYSKPTNNESVNMFKKTIKDIVNKNENFSEEIKKIIE
ncbi:hypothetical protein HN415_09735 [Candidatus Woesearchaeota archaeon]|jgi:uncharacterized protein (UPF0332 family)|nr:hypothetical protein [Candidatus Woesearchaeota archaeon]